MKPVLPLFCLLLIIEPSYSNTIYQGPQPIRPSIAQYHDPFHLIRINIESYNHTIETPYGQQPFFYFDWAATGQMYEPIEKSLKTFHPWVANTHSHSSASGAETSSAYAKARSVIKAHVNAWKDDVLVVTGSGMTDAINKFIRILPWNEMTSAPERPVVFITHMEHHSNEITWRNTDAEVVQIRATSSGEVDLQHFAQLLFLYRERETKIAAVTAASNVTGIRSPLNKLAEMIHQAGSWIVVDYTAAAPYESINMHPAAPEQQLDAIVFSPHKFLGGPGSPGVLIFNRHLYPEGESPDNPGGGTVKWVNAWGEYRFLDDPEAREDGGTPPILQTIRAAMAIRVKESIGIMQIQAQEKRLLHRLLSYLDFIPNLNVLARQQENRLPIVSFTINGLHHDLGVQLLNDRFGIQVRGGCSCAGPYGHILLNVSKELSANITADIDRGDYSTKPGWIRVSLHPSHSEDDIDYLAEALMQLSLNHQQWAVDYFQVPQSEVYLHKLHEEIEVKRSRRIEQLFSF